MEKKNYLEVFQENCCENEKEVIEICEIATQQLKKNFKINLEGVDDVLGVIETPKLAASIFRKIYEIIVAKLKAQQDEYKEFQIVIANRLIIGYSNNDNDENEKNGNFMIYLQHMNTAAKTDVDRDPTLKTVELCTVFNSENITTSVDIIDSIAITALKVLDESMDVKLASKEIIMPLFITIYEALITKLKIYRLDADEYEYEINFISCFWAIAREAEDGNDTISFRPNIEGKLDIKNDAGATAIYE